MRSISRGSKQFERVSLEEMMRSINRVSKQSENPLQSLQTEREPLAEAPNRARTLINYSPPWEDGKSSDNTTFFKEVI